MRHPNVFFLAALLAVIGCSMAESRSAKVESDLSCPDCSIITEDVVLLEGTDFIGPATNIAHSSTGIFYLVDGDGLLKAYGSDGRFVRQIGRRGAGPGEYELIRNVLTSDDGSVHIVDGALGRQSVFAADGSFLRSAVIPVSRGMGMPVALTADSRLAVNSLAGPLPDTGYAVTVIDQGGNPVGQLDRVGSLDLGKRWMIDRLLWPMPNGELLVGQPFRFAVEVYSPDLTKKDSIIRVADWVPPSTPAERPGDGVFDKRFTPRLGAIWHDDQGIVWFYMVVPSNKWRPEPRPEPSELNEEKYATLASRPRLETIIEATDLESRQVLARLRMDGSPGLAFGGGYFAHSDTNSAGEPGLRISRMYLDRGGRGRR